MRVFGALLLVLVGASLIAWKIQPAPAPPGITPLIWVSDDNPARRAHIEQFNRLNPDLQIRLDPDNGGMEKVIVQSLAGVGPDLFDCYGAAQLAAYVKAGIAWDVTEELRKDGVDIQHDVWGATLPYVLYEGRTYGFPANTAVDVLWFNKDVFDKLGLPYLENRPRTWEAFLPLAKKLTRRDADGRIQHFGLSFDPWAWKFFLYQWGGRVYSDDGTRCVLDSPQAVGAVQFLHDLIYKHKAMPSPADEEALAQQGGWGSASIKFLGAGRLATAVGGRWWLCTLRDYKGLRLGAVESPHGPLRRFWGYGKSTVINCNSPRRRQALRFLRYMTGLPYNRLINQQADGLAPMIRYCTDKTLFNPHFPQEDYHRVFREVMPLGEPEQISPFVNAAAAEQLISIQLDLVRRDAKSAAAAMKTAAEQVNEEMTKNLRRNPALRRQWEKLTNANNREGVAP
ncbi:MAG: hypothetical protein AUJ96_29095 [Armatimonadetes bacterium CG2_30_66_41]|nr:extracellular solute-binding protein [Armatimonadota bacterium]NCO90021.1 extracellular solute-binding protein [Armatimonadota bacterium]NCP30330.1 extracellular solute-binding protein [Armatimonadota bacterium]NDK10756.1 extracellular solute-binding protein [Armatimonadota bacterium]OIO94243.1 MAG: hypothetical protein AUJ96_29095 [Armatimonadetes bacterium CG2_30_66_41]